MMILLLWVYYSCQILLFGAEFTRVYAQREGHESRRLSRSLRKTPTPSRRRDTRERCPCGARHTSWERDLEGFRGIEAVVAAN